ncbi:MAG: S41 family peptidase [Clostridia bacterium]|nr:S41 family peptidase [Clostridia bacterium]
MNKKLWLKLTFIAVIVLSALMLTGCLDFADIYNRLTAEEEALIDEYLADYYLFDYNPDEVVFDAENGTLTGLDRYSFYLTPEEYYALMYPTDSEEKMFGISFALGDEGWYVANVVLGSPADLAGVCENDIISYINGNIIYATTPYERLKRLLYNDTISLLLLRDGVEVRTRPITKAYLTMRYLEFFFIDEEDSILTNFDIDYSVTSSARVDKYPHYKKYCLNELDLKTTGYIKLHQFTYTSSEAQQRITQEFDYAMNLFKEAYGGSGKLVLDLNNNPGGYLDYCTQICSYLIKGESPEGTSFQTYDLRDKNGASMITDNENMVTSVYADYFDEDALEPQIVVLTNGGSASASEMLTGCLLVYGTAVQVGTQTYGKGIAQTVMPLKFSYIDIGGEEVLSCSALYFSIAYFYSPAYGDIEYKYYNYCNQTDKNGNGVLDENEVECGFLPEVENTCTSIFEQIKRAQEILGNNSEN